MVSEDREYVPLFETSRAKGRVIYRLFAATIFVCIVSIWIYRATQIPKHGEEGRWAWIGALLAELWFGLYWILTQSLRWNPIYRYTFKDRLALRYESALPKVDIFVCTADPTIEPPVMVINTVLSVMAYDYPPHKLSVYLSDDAGSDLTFYALTEASHFALHWLPYCKKYKIEPRSPAAYFRWVILESNFDDNQGNELVSIKKLYEDMENRIANVTKLGRIPEKIRLENKGFSQWNSFSSRSDHDAILQILIDGRDSNAKDVEGYILPTLVYLAREKRPTHFHNFKAGAMNALIRVSSGISNGKIIMNVDCDMYSNNSQSVRDALCFFLDERKGHGIAFVQFPQKFENVTRNDLYGSSLRVISEVEFHGMDGHGGPLYIGSGCFHRRDTLCGIKFNNEKSKSEWRDDNDKNTQESIEELKERLKRVAACAFEDNTQWGKEMGLKYGCPVEDVITGLSIQCRGWESIYYNPTRPGFLGLAPMSLDQTLIQHKRWSEGDFQIFLSKYSPAIYGLGKISPGLILGYCTYCLWAPNCFAVLFYSLVPSLYLLRGFSLFPKVSSSWIIPFAYVAVTKYSCSLTEFLLSGGTVKGWWNEQRIWLYKRTTSYLFACIDTILKFANLLETKFIITNKVSDPEVVTRYEREMMEFGTDFGMFMILATISMVNLFTLIWVAEGIVTGVRIYAYESLVLQIILCGVLVFVNFPLYVALFSRNDAGKMPSSVMVKSVTLAVSICTCAVFLG